MHSIASGLNAAIDRHPHWGYGGAIFQLKLTNYTSKIFEMDQEHGWPAHTARIIVRTLSAIIQYRFFNCYRNMREVQERRVTLKAVKCST